jgi:hypothetical protein
MYYLMLRLAGWVGMVDGLGGSGVVEGLEGGVKKGWWLVEWVLGGSEYGQHLSGLN